jgi:uncharacterized membrane protein
MAISRVLIPRPFDTDRSGYLVDLWVYRLSQVLFAVFSTMVIINTVRKIDEKSKIARDISRLNFLTGGDFLVVYAVSLFVSGIAFEFGDGVLVCAALLVLVLPRVTKRGRSMDEQENADAQLLEIKTALVIASCYKFARRKMSYWKVWVTK